MQQFMEYSNKQNITDVIDVQNPDITHKDQTNSRNVAYKCHIEATRYEKQHCQRKWCLAVKIVKRKTVHTQLYIYIYIAEKR